jgi:hypothetical protein
MRFQLISAFFPWERHLAAIVVASPSIFDSTVKV